MRLGTESADNSIMLIKEGQNVAVFVLHWISRYSDFGFTFSKIFYGEVIDDFLTKVCYQDMI